MLYTGIALTKNKLNFCIIDNGLNKIRTGRIIVRDEYL